MPSLPSRRRIESLLKPFRVTNGKQFKLKRVDPDDTGGLKSKDAATKLLAAGVERLAELQEQALRPGPLGAAADLPGDGRGRQGRHHQARHVGRQPAGLPGVLLQGAVGRGAGPRLHVADASSACRSAAASASSTARTTRRCWSCGCTPRCCDEQKLPPQLVTKTSGRSASRTSGNFERYLARNGVRDPQVLPARLEGGAEEALSGAARAAGEELEVLDGRRRRSASTGTTTWRPTRT